MRNSGRDVAPGFSLIGGAGLEKQGFTANQWELTVKDEYDFVVFTYLSTAGGVGSRKNVRAVARLGARAAEGLDYAHQLGVVHWDVTPRGMRGSISASANIGSRRAARRRSIGNSFPGLLSPKELCRIRLASAQGRPQ